MAEGEFRVDHLTKSTEIIKNKVLFLSAGQTNSSTREQEEKIDHTILAAKRMPNKKFNFVSPSMQPYMSSRFFFIR